MDAREILLLATGRAKADAVKAMIEGPLTAICTASILQNHPKATIVVDEPAAAKLDHDDYCRWSFDNELKMQGYLEESRRHQKKPGTVV